MDSSNFQNTNRNLLKTNKNNSNLFFLNIRGRVVYGKPTIKLLEWVFIKLSTILVLKIAVYQNGELFWNHDIKLNVLIRFKRLKQFWTPYDLTSLSYYSYVYIYVETIELWLLKGSHHLWFAYFIFLTDKHTHTHTHTQTQTQTHISTRTYTLYDKILTYFWIFE